VSNAPRWVPHVASAAVVDVFFIDTQTGQVATRRQLVEAGQADETERPVAPWFPIRGDPDASTLWFAVMRKKERGVYIGTLCFRHTDWHASLLDKGWEEVPVGEIRPEP
jgi:hypothetical protein